MGRHHLLLIASILVINFLNCSDSDTLSLSPWRGSPYSKEGILNKYYETTITPDKTSKDISYEWLHTDGNTLHRYVLAINMDTSLYYQYKISGNQWGIIDFDAGWARSDSEVTIEQDIPFSSEKAGGDCSITVIDASEGTVNIRIQQIGVRDTTIGQNPGQIVSMVRTIMRNEDTLSQWSMDQIYVDRIGLYASVSTDGKNKIIKELVEQLTQEDANKLRKEISTIKRVGHIRDLNGLKICGDRDDLYDYYNDDIAEYIGGKRPLWQMLESDYDPTFYENQSGYLTYRFVINCEGRAGGFIIEETGYNYKPMVFEKTLKSHFMKKLKAVETWKPLRVNGQPKDAYTYITIKLKNGKIDEILP